MDRCAWLLVVAVATASCALDKQGTGTTDELQGDSALDSEAFFDTGAADTNALDTTVVSDSFVTDSSVDTFEAAVDTGPPFCDPSDLTLIACFRFEGDGKDGSSHMNDLTVIGGTYVPGVDGQAISISPTTTLTAIENTSFAVTTQLTLELWVRLRSLPTTGRMGLIDDDGRFGLFIYPPGTARAMSPAPLDAAAPFKIGKWTHVAYTFDGETMTMFL
ncbi:MAG: LamG-like jellyroll fold domain-containing protein, partial [Polyangiales bacterium]